MAYTYDETWGDLLTGYDGSTIESDTIGNMTFFNGWTFTWEHGRELASLSKDGTTWTNTYNADGLRTKRTDGTTTYNYVYNGSSLSQMTVGTHLLNFVYDASGAPMAVTYDGVTYYYATNLQGDVIAILDSTGAAVVQYMYDAWGKLWDTSGSMATTLGAHNPLRYRGYVYDPETSLYYLQSRYYDPELGRFINADAFTSTGQGLLGNNMFAYCNNSPVFFVDSSGQSLVPHTYATSDCRTGLTMPYITDQDDPPIADKEFGLASVSHGGCGVIASYNALMTMGHTAPFDEVLAYYNSRMGFTLGFGFTGLLPYNVTQYFTSLGFDVVTTNQKEQIDLLSKTADGCIMYYEFPQTYYPLGIPFDAYGAHFVEYHREDSNFVAVNTNGKNGMTTFSVPSQFGYSGDQHSVVCIFIFE